MEDLEAVATLWKDNFSFWSPAQSEMKMDVNVGNGKKHHYVIYLRWRNDNPWRAYLVKTPPDYEIEGEDSLWLELKVFEWEQGQEEDLKQDALEEAVKKLKEIYGIE